MQELTSFSDVERLVQRFYGLGNPREIKLAEEQLQKITNSSQGWRLADALLQSADQKVRFFGALTFERKINRDWSTLEDDDGAAVLQQLLHHFIHLVARGEPALVIKKVCNALVAYCLLPSSSWNYCVRHVILCLLHGKVVPIPLSLHDDHSTETMMPTLGGSGKLAILWFTTGLAEQTQNGMTINAQTQKYHDRVASNLADVVAMLAYFLRLPFNGEEMSDASMKQVQGSLTCFQAWVEYVQRTSLMAAQKEVVQSLTPLALHVLEVGELYEEAADCIADILINFSAFLKPSDNVALSLELCTRHAQSLIAEMKEGDFGPEAMAFAGLLLAYGDANIQELVRQGDANHTLILEELMELLHCRGHPGIDDEICSRALEFWTMYVEYVTDFLFTVEPDDRPSWTQVAQQRMIEVIEACYVKIRHLSGDELASWDTDAKEGFQSFRTDFRETLQTSYTLLGLDIFKKFAWLALTSLNERNWSNLESALFCLNSLTDIVTAEEAVDDACSQIFGSSLFTDMAGEDHTTPVISRQAAVTMVINYMNFFERHPTFLGPMLNFLFASIRIPALSNVAAKAIHTACSSCRTKLVLELPTFIQQYKVMLEWGSTNAYTKEKVVGGIAAIIQTLANDEQKLASLIQLVDFVQRDIQIGLLQANANIDDLQEHSICALKSLSSIGKALQTPDDVAIELDAAMPSWSFWTDGPGSNLQSIIADIIVRLANLMPYSSEVMETCCQILRSGYRETKPGLFVFPAKLTVDFVQNTTLKNARLEYVIDTASAMLTRPFFPSGQDTQLAAQTLLNHNGELLACMNYNPSNEPEVAASIIDFVDKLIPRFIASMKSAQHIAQTFSFSLTCLASSEIMPKRSAARFWTTIAAKRDIPEDDANFVHAIIQHHGGQLSQILIHNIAGEAPRSMLDTLSIPLRTLISAQPQAKQWISEALNSSDFPSQKVRVDEKRVWLQKIMSLRGARKTNNEVRDFWIACRGQESAFGF